MNKIILNISNKTIRFVYQSSIREFIVATLSCYNISPRNRGMIVIYFSLKNYTAILNQHLINHTANVFHIVLLFRANLTTFDSMSVNRNINFFNIFLVMSYASYGCETVSYLTNKPTDYVGYRNNTNLI